MPFIKPLKQAEFPSRTAASGAAAVGTATWSAGPQGVMIWADQACYVEVGEGVVASTGSTSIPANTPVVLAVPMGEGGPWRVSVLQVAVAGTVYCKPVNIA